MRLGHEKTNYIEDFLMHFPIYNHSNMDLDSVKHLFNSFLSFALKYIGIPECPDIYLKSDKENSKLPLGKTGFYDSSNKKIVIFTDNRHIKDILRSLSHELVHHRQDLQGMFDKSGYHGPGYAQKNQHLRSMEREAYEIGNLCLRDWEDKHKKQLQESIYTIKGDNFKMSYKKWRNVEINERLMESWGYKAPKSSIINENNEISHLCATLVTEKATGKVGHPINHTLLEDGTVTHYDVEFDDVIVEGMPVSSLKVEVQKEHMHTARREDDEASEDKPRVSNEAHCGRREDDEELEEEAKPDFPDVDGDGDRDEPISKAQKEKKEKEGGGKKSKDLSKVPPQLRKHVASRQANEDLIRKTIREAITKALKERSEG